MVRLRADVSASSRPGTRGEVVGVTLVETAEHAASRGVPVGTTIYMVELGDGSSVEVPEAWLEDVDQLTDSFFDSTPDALGPPLTDEMVLETELRLGVKLNRSYLQLLRVRNGGYARRRRYPTDQPTSWASDHFEITHLIGVGYEDGIDGSFGSRYLVSEWGYPDTGIVVFGTATGGHDTVMLDYRECVPRGEPVVIYVSEERTWFRVADSFEAFVDRLEGPQSPRRA